jgi:hypothetical protein
VALADHGHDSGRFVQRAEHLSVQFRRADHAKVQHRHAVIVPYARRADWKS